MRILVENESTNAAAGTRGLFIHATPHNQSSGTVLEIQRDLSNMATADLQPIILISEVYGGGEVNTASGIRCTMDGSTLTAAVDLFAIQCGAVGGTGNNFALQAMDGDIAIDSAAGKLLLGETQQGEIYFETGDGLTITVPGGAAGMVLNSAGILTDFPVVANTESDLGGQLILGNDTGTPAQGKIVYDNAAGDLEFYNTWDADTADFIFFRSAGTELFRIGGDAEVEFQGSAHFDDNDRVYFGTGNDASMYFSGTDAFITLPSTSSRLRVTGRTYFNSGNLQLTSTTNFCEVQAIGNSSTESNSTLIGNKVAVLTGSSAGRGVNYATYLGARVEASFTRSGDLTYASREATFKGGDFRTTYSGSGVVSGNASGSKWHAGEFITNITTSATVTISEAWGGLFSVGGSPTSATISDAIAGKFISDLSGAGTVTRNYGILVTDIDGGTTEWGINVNGADVQISSNNYLFLEGGETTKGDTGLRYNSSADEVEFDMHGTTAMRLTADGLIIPIKSTTGDPTGVEGLMYHNSSDNKVRIYADGSWRDLVTW